MHKRLLFQLARYLHFKWNIGWFIRELVGCFQSHTFSFFFFSRLFFVIHFLGFLFLFQFLHFVVQCRTFLKCFFFLKELLFNLFWERSHLIFFFFFFFEGS
ncbi:hypothetical protein CROQUDRAFT_466880 [Cronartium quercuum f. sp. fusiforme G11]|uniref:Uncharacterized protein n=1 Tax=Cronartium quercuum f. sp. fusiforme G11 TaxID=708437 RepID=A0A9P6NWV5_9BASI|nr:hypothetical protein CROQUDRAFT_466880 [Cronartium quercuum f. sp. fusiforme G11]